MIVTREEVKKYNSISLKTSFHIVNTICIHGSWKRLVLTHWDSNANSFWAKTPWHFESHRPNHCWEIQSRFPWCFWLIKWSIHGETFRFLRSNLFDRHQGCVTMATIHRNNSIPLRDISGNTITSDYFTAFCRLSMNNRNNFVTSFPCAIRFISCLRYFRHSISLSYERVEFLIVWKLCSILSDVELSLMVTENEDAFSNQALLKEERERTEGASSRKIQKAWKHNGDSWRYVNQISSFSRKFVCKSFSLCYCNRFVFCVN